MNSKHFHEWFKRVVGLMPNKSAIVIDQAPYHKQIDPETKNPTMSWLKKDIISWLQKRNISLPPHSTDYAQLTKAALIEHAKPHFGIPKKILENIIEDTNPGIKLIWLPVAHCELNAIELIWAYVKNNIAKINRRNAAEKGNSITVTRDLCKEVLQTVTPDLWKKCIRHAQNIEDKYWEKDHLSDEVPLAQPIIVDLQNDSDSDSDTDYDFDIEGNISDLEN
ncbi:uncharacterized protein LOC129002330 [Macrosteles quadrilineatus]|uniref:uncharacterized protein LOC129002330 n=1 Tax=Macrosteles quadrilineatus TaxID=74068 RepID=UPI0023E2CFE4|nr:uncharacterized protein LOC129002330 [Macrosteles quadrilineatus]